MVTLHPNGWTRPFSIQVWMVTLHPNPLHVRVNPSALGDQSPKPSLNCCPVNPTYQLVPRNGQMLRPVGQFADPQEVPRMC